MIFNAFISVGLLLITLVAAWFYPVANGVLICLLVGYYGLLLKKPMSWLFVIPAILPVLNFAPWSGYVLFEEFDFFLLVTIAGTIFTGTYNVFNFKVQNWIVYVYLGSTIISLIVGLESAQGFGFNDLSNYLSPYNSIRIGRSFFWAFLFIPLLNKCAEAEYKPVAFNHMIAGFSTGVLLTGLIIFWERGVISDILTAATKYDYFRSLLDFSSEYRTTALFSEMNTGGSAIDGYAGMTWIFPLTGYMLSMRKNIKENRIGIKAFFHAGIYLAVFFVSLYIIATTFTRITYLAFFISFCIFVAGLFISQNTKSLFSDSKKLIGGSVAFLCFVMGLTRTFQQGGYVSIVAAFGLIIVFIFIGLYLNRFNRLFMCSIGLCAFLLTVFLMTKSSVISKYNPSELSHALTETVFICLAFAITVFYFTRRCFDKNQIIKYLSFIVPLMFIIFISIPILSGFRISKRFSESFTDAGTRFSHWTASYQLMNDGIISKFCGMGLGSFPRVNFEKVEESRQTGFYEYINEYGNGILRLYGGSDMEIGQRLLSSKINPDSAHRIIVVARAQTLPKNISIRICSRNLMHAADCKYFSPKLVAQEYGWGFYAIPIEKGVLKPYSWYSKWPKVLLVRNKTKNTVLDISEIRLENDKGQQLLENNAFEFGGQRWFSYNEFEHLPWHIKSMYLDLIFEQGYLGLVVFLLMVGAAFINLFKKLFKGEFYSLTWITAMSGFLIVGITGTLVDVPRIMFLFYMLLLSILSPHKGLGQGFTKAEKHNLDPMGG